MPPKNNELVFERNEKIKLPYNKPYIALYPKDWNSIKRKIDSLKNKPIKYSMWYTTLFGISGSFFINSIIYFLSGTTLTIPIFTLIISASTLLIGIICIYFEKATIKIQNTIINDLQQEITDIDELFNN